MKIYSDSKGDYLMLRNGNLKSAGFTEGKEYSVKYKNGKIILTLDEPSLLSAIGKGDTELVKQIEERAAQGKTVRLI